MSDKFRPALTPYGASSFDVIRQGKRAYVDKTRFIETLENCFGLYPVVMRPRRFGKSVFATMLESYYDMKEAQNFDENFRGTYIYEHRTPLAGKFRVLTFDFSGLSSAPDLSAEFTEQVRAALDRFVGRYPFDGAREVLEKSYGTAGTLLDTFFNKAVTAFGNTIYVIIDEYDQFANQVLATDKEAFKGITAKDGFLKDFYAKLKTATKTAVNRTFITGVTAVTLDSMTSGFNIADVVTTDPLLAEAFGFTGDEVRSLIRQLVDLSACGMTEEEVFVRMKDYYNGYRFSDAADETVFNAAMCLYYLRNLATRKREPADMTDRSADSDMDKIHQILSYCGNADFLRQTAEDALAGRPVVLDALSQNLNFNNKAVFDRNDVLSLLFYMGYLTFSKDSENLLVCPNKAVREQFFRMYFQYLAEVGKVVFTANELRGEFEAMRAGDLHPFVKSVGERMQEKIGVHGLSKLSEMVIEVGLLMAADKNYAYQVTAESESHGRGFMDLLFVPRPECSSSCACAYVLELKYLPKGHASASEIDAKAAEARRQLERYVLGSNLSMAVPLKKIVVVFVGLEIVRFEEVP